MLWRTTGLRNASRTRPAPAGTWRAGGTAPFSSCCGRTLTRGTEQTSRPSFSSGSTPSCPAATSAVTRSAGRPSLPEPDWGEVREALGALVAPRGEHLLDQVKIELHRLLEDSIKDPHRRAQAINLLITRTAMIELDEALSALQEKAHDYRSSGLRSAQKIAENLQATAISAVLPLGMLGRAITGYRVAGLDDREKNAALVAQTIAGDPHTFTAELGGIVSLILAGIERPVMGLSATAYFPQAVREHLHAPVRWWMTDAQANSIRARKAPHRLWRGPPTVRRAHQGLRHPPQPQEGRAHRARRQPVRPVHPP